METINKLKHFIGKEGIETLTSKVKESQKDSILNSALIVAQTTHLKSMLEGCSKLSYVLPTTDIKMEINKSEDKWSGKVIVKSESYDIKDLTSELLCATVLTMTKSEVDLKTISNQEFIDTIKQLTKSYKPKVTSLLLKKTHYDCLVCKSEIAFGETVNLCPCLAPLKATDVRVNKINDKTKVTFNDNWSNRQLKYVLKLVTKSLQDDYEPKI